MSKYKVQTRFILAITIRMPEGPEVRRVADWLNSELTGKILTDIQWSTTSRYCTVKRHPTQTPDGYLQLQPHLPMTITNVRSHGKMIIFGLNRADGTSMYLINHLNMEGYWSYDFNKHSGLWLVLEPDQRLYFNDSRKFGYLAAYPSLEELQTALTKKVGPDLLEAGLTGCSLLEEWRATVAKRGRVMVSEFLHNQKNFAGIGNYLRAEIMYEAGINPQRKMADLTPAEIDLLYDRTIAIMVASYQSRGLTISSYQDPSGHRGTYDVKVYGRKIDDLGNPIEKYKRTTTSQTIHWCPNLQR